MSIIKINQDLLNVKEKPNKYPGVQRCVLVSVLQLFQLIFVRFLLLKKQGQLANDATSSVYDYYLRRFLSGAWLMTHFSTFLIGWSRHSRRNARFSVILTKA